MKDHNTQQSGILGAIIKDKNETIQYTQEQAQEYLNNWKRAEADLINYKKDEVKRVALIMEFGSEKLILEILDMLANLDTTIRQAPEVLKGNPWFQWMKGLEHTRQSFEVGLRKYGVQRIATIGEKFNPVLHEAVEGQGEVVSEEVRAGYIMHNKVIRPARVIIN